MESLRPNAPPEGSDLRALLLSVREFVVKVTRHFRDLTRDGSAFVLGGRLGVGATPAATEADSHLTVTGNEATALQIAIVNEGAGEVAFVLNRLGGVVNRWRARMGLASGRLTLTSDALGDTLQLMRLTLATDSTALLILTDNGGSVSLRQVKCATAPAAGKYILYVDP